MPLKAKPLECGEKAPAFQSKTFSGEKIKLSDYLGNYTALYFYPKDNTPGCTNQACNLQTNLSQLKKRKISIIGVSPDKNESHEKFTEKHGLDFPLIADPEHKIIEKYGVWGEKKNYGKTYMGLHRTTFLINPKGKIVHVFSRPKTKEHAEEILAKVKELQQK
ncbi:MAG: thioredoxin-dependent thiol peroxidase [Acidimicrobiales bacterium]|jgi:peroxiredoxin Q/BCP|nr:thioredoxin-dependent thiol peroxidase [Acidimicrobiales bacterium]MDP6298785.1 thioredoxin-dependent thiol peroxidase [Acidimicrobiales bacterium]HJM27667.1 thioredoxin-dependent thiol peroxidase [Acidimicrobiales bacterium]HJM97079.1 thioredoxin-dependent thiol peroxidase [Acidimicrobiales bacterium]